jgi:two-component system, CitB family, sensor kinase
MVAVGITIASIDQQLRSDLELIGISALLVLAVGLAGTWLVGRRLRRQTHGLGAAEITRMYEYYTAVLGAVREGLLLLDTKGGVQLVNDEARRLLDLPDDVVGRPLDSLGLAPGLVATALGRTAEADDIYLAGDRVLVVSSSPATWQGADVGAVVTLRDHTELRAVTGQLDVVRELSDSLRAQNHESANRLHTMVSLIELGRVDEAVDFATEELQVAQLLTDQVVGAVGDPVVEALLLGKHADAAERGIELRIRGSLPDSDTAALGVGARDLVTVLGNLVDNAFDALVQADVRRVRVTLGGEPTAVVVTVEDSGPGLDDDAVTHALERGWTTKGSGEGGRGVGLALVAQVARRHGGDVEIGRSALGGARFTVTLHPVEALR